MLKHTHIECLCELCHHPVGLTIQLGELADKIPDLEIPGDNKYPMGLCPECKLDLEAGAAYFTDATGRVLKASVEATKEKIAPSYWGKVIRLPVSVMDELMKLYNEAHK